MPYSDTCPPPSEFSEATANQHEICRWDNLCLNFLSVKEKDISTFLHLGVVTVDTVLIFKASRFYSEKICLKLLSNEGLSSLPGKNSKITASVIQTSPPSEFKRKHSICNTSRQSLLSFCFVLVVCWFFGVFFTLACISCLKRPARSLNPL